MTYLSEWKFVRQMSAFHILAIPDKSPICVDRQVTKDITADFILQQSCNDISIVALRLVYMPKALHNIFTKVVFVLP